MDLSVIIVNYNTKQLTKACIDSVIKNTKGIKYEFLVVDNGSTDDSVAVIRNSKFQIPNSKLRIIINKENLGFGRANNQGMKEAKGRYILLLNSDTLIQDNVLGEMVFWMDKNPKVGIASCNLLNKDGTIQGTGGYFPTLLRVFSWMTIQDLPYVDHIIKPFHPMHQKSFRKEEGFFKKGKELDWVTGAFFLMRKDVYEAVGGFDQDYFMYTEEVDYCFRAKEKGWRVYYIPNWSILHYGGASGKSWSYVILEFESLKLFYKKHYPKWQYPLLRFFLKLGALGRIFLFGVLEGKEAALIYAKAFKVA